MTKNSLVAEATFKRFHHGGMVSWSNLFPWKIPILFYVKNIQSTTSFNQYYYFPYISVAIYTKLMNLIIFGYTQTKLAKFVNIVNSK